MFKSQTILLSLIGFLFIEFSFANSNKYYLATKPANFNIAKPNFAKLDDIHKKKKLFIQYILKAIDQANIEISVERKQIIHLQTTFKKNDKLSSKQQKVLQKYTNFYKIYFTKLNSDVFKKLLIKANTIPKSIVIAQAILESGWGTSRFASQYNNYFGLHCFEPDCGVKARGANDVYIEIFNNTNDSVLGYYHRLNTVSLFNELRNVRAKASDKQDKVGSIVSALGEYSGLEDNKYQTRINDVIRHNNLKKYDATSKQKT